MQRITYPFVRHLNCEKCEKAGRPFKKQKGITLHLVRLVKVEGDNVRYATVCVLCGCRSIPHTNQVEVLHENQYTIPIKEWNALIKINHKDDGFKD